MITLHGFSASNYYNIVKHVLLYKEIPYEEHVTYGGGDEWLSISPVGKVPAITTEDGRHLSESAVICEYLEETYPEKPLYPAAAYERARVRQIMKVAELYLELPSRSLIAYAFSGKPAPEPAIANARHQTGRGLEAMRRLCLFSPHIAGDTFGIADIYVHYVNAVVLAIGCPQMDWDIVGEVPGMKEWGLAMRDSDIARRVEAERKANEPEFFEYISNYMANNAIPGK